MKKIRRFIFCVSAFLLFGTGLLLYAYCFHTKQLMNTAHQICDALYSCVLEVPKHEGMYQFFNSEGYRDANTYIAHGGGVGDLHYTNSEEGVEDALKKGFRFIELDLMLTTDGHIVAGHNWRDLKETCGVETPDNEPLSYKDFCNLRQRSPRLHPLDEIGIVRVMKQNPQLYLVVDKIKKYDVLMEKIPFPERMIVEVFSVTDYAQALNAGILYPAFCIWETNGCRTAEKWQFPIVTLWASGFFGSDDKIKQVQALHRAGVTVMVFYAGSDYDRDANFLKEHAGKSFSKVYTDVWTPEDIPQLADEAQQNEEPRAE